MAEEAQVALFLMGMKQAAQERFILVDRKKNLDALAKRGMTVNDAKRTILGLMPCHYVSGPNPNHNVPGESVWIFCVILGDEEIYIKLDVRTGSSNACICISFHEASETSHLPYKRSE